VFAPPNYLLFTRDGTLYAQRLDVKTLQLQSEPVRAAENVGEADRKGGGSSFAVSDNGVLVYREKLAPITHQLAWYDRRGNRLKPVGPPGGFTYISLSPDEKYVAATGLSEGRQTSCLWLLTVKSGGIQCITPEAKGLAAIPAWSADSKSIAVALDGILHSVNVATGTSQVLSRDVNVTYPYDWSPDGKYIIGNPGGGAKPSLLSLEGDRKVTSLLASQVAVRGFRFSPDGKWVAYFMNDSGQDQVYVSAFPSMDRKRQISTSGGRYPVWRRDGRELFFVAYDSTLMAADIRTDRGLELSFPKPLFRLNMATNMDQYAANADASQFLVSDLLTDDPRREITVVLNWPSEIKK
jgi:WD40 repeat protein